MPIVANSDAAVIIAFSCASSLHSCAWNFYCEQEAMFVTRLVCRTLRSVAAYASADALFKRIPVLPNTRDPRHGQRLWRICGEVRCTGAQHVVHQRGRHRHAPSVSLVVILQYSHLHRLARARFVRTRAPLRHFAPRGCHGSLLEMRSHEKHTADPLTHPNATARSLCAVMGLSSRSYSDTSAHAICCLLCLAAHSGTSSASGCGLATLTPTGLCSRFQSQTSVPTSRLLFLWRALVSRRR